MHDRLDDLLREIIGIFTDESLGLISLSCLCGNLNLFECIGGTLDSSPVHLDDIFTLPSEGLLDSILVDIDSLLLREDAGNLEECSQHDSIDSCSKTNFLGILECVVVLESNLLVDDLLLFFRGEVLEHFIGGNLRVQEEHASIFQRSKHIVSTDIGRIVTSYEIGIVDQPRHIHRTLSETEVTYGDTAGLLRVV